MIFNIVGREVDGCKFDLSSVYYLHKNECGKKTLQNVKQSKAIIFI